MFSSNGTEIRATERLPDFDSDFEREYFYSYSEAIENSVDKNGEFSETKCHRNLQRLSRKTSKRLIELAKQGPDILEEEGLVTQARDFRAMKRLKTLTILLLAALVVLPPLAIGYLSLALTAALTVLCYLLGRTRYFDPRRFLTSEGHRFYNGLHGYEKYLKSYTDSLQASVVDFGALDRLVGDAALFAEDSSLLAKAEQRCPGYKDHSRVFLYKSSSFGHSTDEGGSGSSGGGGGGSGGGAGGTR